MILLDTNVLSEALKPLPANNVIVWLNDRFSECAICSVTIFELEAGVAVLEHGQRRDALAATVARTIRRFGSRIYAFDAPAAYSAAKLVEQARSRGLGAHQMRTKLADLQIGGIATAYGLSLATRNFGDFQGLGLTLINPWDPGGPD